MTKEYIRGYTEVMQVLRLLPQHELDMIPKETIDFLNNNQREEYKIKINKNASLKEIQLSKVSEIILFNFFKKYWATPRQKEIITQMERKEYQKNEKNKQDEYNSNNIFKRNN